MTKERLPAGTAHGLGDVEVAVRDDNSVAVRQASSAGATTLEFTPSEWNAFVAGAKAGEFDQPW